MGLIYFTSKDLKGGVVCHRLLQFNKLPMAVRPYSRAADKLVGTCYLMGGVVLYNTYTKNIYH